MTGSYFGFGPWTLAHVLVWHRWPYWAIFPTLRAKWFKPRFPPFLFLVHTLVQLRRTRLTDSYIFLTLVPIVASQVDFNCSVYKMRSLIGLRNCFKETPTERCSLPYRQYLEGTRFTVKNHKVPGERSSLIPNRLIKATYMQIWHLNQDANSLTRHLIESD